MSALNMHLEDAGIKRLISEAILANMTDEGRNQLIKDAIVHLTGNDPEQQRYGRRVSPLTDAFNKACVEQANQLAREYVAEHPEFKKAIQDTFSEAGAKALLDVPLLRKTMVESAIRAIYQLKEDAEREYDRP